MLPHVREKLRPSALFSLRSRDQNFGTLFAPNTSGIHLAPTSSVGDTHLAPRGYSQPLRERTTCPRSPSKDGAWYWKLAGTDRAQIGDGGFFVLIH